uniref:Photosynthetic NDH subunit of subcomplex B 3, chloroplastic n=1 Tax=Vitis vinifera TaxID=29760 RepID=A5BML8_VITVI|nr:hypothetical protein VITISV_011434 [Vitis vinifera]
MGTLQLNSYGLSSFSLTQNFTSKTHKTLKPFNPPSSSRPKIKAIGTIPESQSQATPSDEPPSVNFAFVNSVLLPDGTPDVHFRSACGGQKLRDIMLDSNIDLYGPYVRILDSYTVIEGKELLTPRTDKEKEKLKRVVIQQLPEWKAHEWTYEKELPSET